MPSRVLSSQEVQEDATPVTQVRVVVHTQGAAGPNTSDNHWSLYLVHPNGTSSIRINMRAEFGDPTGILEWTKHDYVHSISTVRYWDFPVAAGITVLFFARLIYNLRRDRYDMSGGGSGCRWWVYNVMSDMAQENYIHQSAPGEIWPNLLFLYHKHQERRELQMVRGEFV
ncbi:uncharacterized protein TRUGW13939_09565 [Talaromyces rugulosus]|uniref:DUF7770 domain-containing protein n=1 Tax=Talaromyces rugulosus TaxID=121627 RepID=A0A7H8R839_TALRU|nr:uncharacterized protein TRUGW13939_09565 [Talaromyces rugulosus]QKX62406.1 hypothetical protein TRUGW13939_09565 [Talaromyces rugulosus]